MTAPPPHAERIQLGGETAWLWETKWDRRIGDHDAKGSCWSLLQGRYQVDLENIERDGQTRHTIDWSDRVPHDQGFEGGLARNEPGHLDRPPFLEQAERLLAALRRRDAQPPSPDAKQPQ